MGGGGQLEQASSPGFSFHEHFVPFFFFFGRGGTIIMHSHVTISVPNEYILKA